ncbi:MAG: hypothetical protein V1850_02155 [Candidatus Bathyarchaeota archaeon]
MIRNTGYKLIVNPSEDPLDLARSGGGLAVIGRGAKHQVDVLGQLQWIPAFTFPLRLFVEAKFKGAKTGIPTVRNALGIILDVNKKNYPSTSENKPVPIFHYVYALFSISGFSEQAQKMALAHQISLIDLSGSEYSRLTSTIEAVAEKIQTSISRNRLIYNLRHSIRIRLGTISEDNSSEDQQLYDPTLAGLLNEIIEPVIIKTREYHELFVGMAICRIQLDSSER